MLHFGSCWYKKRHSCDVVAQFLAARFQLAPEITWVWVWVWVCGCVCVCVCVCVCLCFCLCLCVLRAPLFGCFPLHHFGGPIPKKKTAIGPAKHISGPLLFCLWRSLGKEVGPRESEGSTAFPPLLCANSAGCHRFRKPVNSIMVCWCT